MGRERSREEKGKSERERRYIIIVIIYMYNRLRDPVFEVRHNTVIVLTHLILNDMVKVKGQISEMALCLEDDEQRIVDRTKLFFHELSQKVRNILRH